MRGNPLESLEKWRLPEDLCASAYEAVSGASRAVVKTALALAAFHYPAFSSERQEMRLDKRLGFREKILEKPASLCLLLIPPAYRAMARCCSCAVLPLLAGVKNTAALFLDGAPSPSILATLELCGIEDLYAVPSKKICGFLDSLPEETAVAGLFGLSQEIASLARKKAARCFIEEIEPKIAVADPDAFDKAGFEFALGSPPCAHPFHIGEKYDAIYLKNAAKLKPGADALHITPGCEGFWIFPGLTPDFFLFQGHSFSFYEGAGHGVR